MTDMEEFSTPSYPSGDITLLTVEIVRNRAAIGELKNIVCNFTGRDFAHLELKDALEQHMAAVVRAAIRELVDVLQLAEETLCSLESDLREFGVDDCGAELAILTARAAIAKHDTSTTTTKEGSK